MSSIIVLLIFTLVISVFGVIYIREQPKEIAGWAILIPGIMLATVSIVAIVEIVAGEPRYVTYTRNTDIVKAESSIIRLPTVKAVTVTKGYYPSFDTRNDGILSVEIGKRDPYVIILRPEDYQEYLDSKGKSHDSTGR